MAALLGVGCGGRGGQPNGQIPEQCALPAGVTVTGLALDESQAGTLPATGTTGFAVRATIAREPAAADSTVIVCFVVRDRDLVFKQIASGLVILPPGETDATREAMFELRCDGDGHVEGHSITSAFGLDDSDSSTGERSTQIFVQHAESVKLLAGQPVGLRGTKSEAIRVACP